MLVLNDEEKEEEEKEEQEEEEEGVVHRQCVWQVKYVVDEDGVRERGREARKACVPSSTLLFTSFRFLDVFIMLKPTRRRRT